MYFSYYIVLFAYFNLCCTVFGYPKELNDLNANEKLESIVNIHHLVSGFVKPLGFTELNPKLENDRNFPFIVKSNVDLTDISNNNYTTNKCENDLYYVLENIPIKSQWALKLIDSYGKPESGIMLGNARWVGDYNECINVHAPLKENYTHSESNSTIGNFNGKYCTMQFYKNYVPSISSGICIPNSCSASKLEDNFRKLINITELFDLSEILPFFGKNDSLDVTITCKPSSRSLNAPAIGVLSLISFFALLVLLGSLCTVYEYFQNVIKSRLSSQENLSIRADDMLPINTEIENNGRKFSNDKEVLFKNSENDVYHTIRPYLKCFCIFTNGAKILDVSTSEGQLPSIHGIRFLSMAWIILCHTYAFSFTVLRNIVDLSNLYNEFLFQIVLQGFFSVDSFFVLSGFLLTYLFLKQTSKSGGKVSWLYFYVHRYLRLTPVYMIVLGFSTTLARYLSFGPFWPDGDIDINCKNNWWWNLLYINNFLKTTDQCMGWSWYLANDMQFYIISPLFLYMLYRWPKIGFCLLGLFLCGSSLSNFFITYEYDLFPGIVALSFRKSNLNVTSSTSFPTMDLNFFLNVWTDYFEKIYIKPYTRISPYLIGIILGYLICKYRLNKKQLNLWQLIIGWIFMSSITLACIFGLYHSHPTTLASSFYNALNRTVYAIGLAWVIYVCLTDQGGFVNSLLSFRFFIPLSRLTYCAYLIHPIVITVYFQSMMTTLEFSHITIVTLFLGFLAISYGIAFFTSLFFESPIMGLEKIIMKKFIKI